MKVAKYAWWLLLALVCHMAVGDLLEEDDPPADADEERWQKRTSALVIATLLIVLSICFEFGKEKIEETTSEELKPVIDHLFQELTVLGFLSLLTFLLVQIGTKAGYPISTAIFGTKEDELLSELIEFIHMGLFAVLVVFIFEVVLLIRLGEKEKRKWIEGEILATNHQARLIVNYRKSARVGGQDRFIWRLLPFLNPSVHHEENMNYFAIRREFISPRDLTKPRLPKDFKFNEYLSICMGEVLGELVEISPKTWFCLEIFFVIVYGVSYLPFVGMLVAYLVFGWLLLIEMALVAAQLNRIKLALIPRLNVKRKLVNEATALLSEEEFSSPRYLSQKLQRRTAIGRFIYGPPANKHQLLFWGDTKGPHLLVFTIRLVILLSAIYISFILFFSTVIFREYYEYWWSIFVLIPVALFPIIILAFFFTPRVLRLQVMVSNIEMLKNQEVINKVLRAMKTAKSLKTLKVIQLMKFKTRKRSKDEEAQMGVQQSLEEMPKEKVESLREVFNLFDLDGSGKIDLQELVQVFGTLGQEMTELEARELITELDKDGDGELDFEEFAGYFQQSMNLQNEDPEEVVRNMFSIFDRNSDGDITVGEFTAILQKLGSSLTLDDIQAVVDEVDRDGDGNISLEEFEVLVRKHLLEEKKAK